MTSHASQQNSAPGEVFEYTDLMSLSSPSPWACPRSEEQTRSSNHIKLTKRMKIVYVWDALCGWCYGFGAVLIPFLENHPELELEIVSGGLFVDEHSQPIGQLAHIPQANERITQTYGVRFGKAYEQVLKQGELVLNSYHPALALNVFKSLTPAHQHIHIAKLMQEAFYVEGRSLSDVETYLHIGQSYGLNREELGERIRQAWQSPKEGTAADFARGRALEIEVFPTLLLEHEGRRYAFRGALKSVEALEARLAEHLSAIRPQG